MYLDDELLDELFDELLDEFDDELELLFPAFTGRPALRLVYSPTSWLMVFSGLVVWALAPPETRPSRAVATRPTVFFITSLQGSNGVGAGTRACLLVSTPQNCDPDVFGL